MMMVTKAAEAREQPRDLVEWGGFTRFHCGDGFNLVFGARP